MSGYSSRAEVIRVVKGTISVGSPKHKDLSRDPRDYFISRIVDDIFAPRSDGGWGVTRPSEEAFFDSVRWNRRSR